MTRRLSLLLAALLGLSACASDTAIDSTLGQSVELLRERIAARQAPEAPVLQISTEQRVALGQRLIPAGPLVLATTVEGGGESILFLSARNGDVTGLTSAGGQSIALRDGLLLNTRGLKYDLLSSDSAASGALIAARAEGRATRVHETSTVDLSGDRQVYDCAVAPAGHRDITLPSGESKATTLVIENCRNATENFVNQYWVGRDGHIWQSRQWVGPNYGHIDFATIRR